MSRSDDVSMEDRCFEEAAEWHARWRHAAQSGLPAEEVDRWAKWSKVPHNKRAYDAVDFVSRARHSLAPPPLPTAAELAADASDGVVFIRPTGGAPTPRFNAARWRGAAVFALAAAAAVVAFKPAMHWLRGWLAEPTHVVSTTSGEIKQILLRDGSRVTLGAKTEITVQFEQCRRTIALNSGEALFKVAHDPRCPFIVIAGGGAITALGTEFSVRRTLDRVTVQVAEGIVDVQPRDALVAVPWPKDPDIPSVTWPDAKLTQGQEVTYAGTEKRSAVASEDPNVATAWLDGRRVYRHEPLAYLVADIGRYFEEPIDVSPDVGDLQFTGLVYESQVKKFLQDLEIIFPVKVTHTDDNHILIESRDATSAPGSDSPQTPDTPE